MKHMKPKTKAQQLSEKLGVKSCPFCGGEARLKQKGNRDNTWYVQCTGCGIRTTYAIQLPYQAWQDVKYVAVLDWNRRVGEDNLAEQKRLTELCLEEVRKDRGIR